jgi:glyoxylase-like metal-dependent hydrolase (beta-lactamase superfamily II)
MRVVPLRKNQHIYTCNAYLILGDWNRLDDVNALVDVGSDDYILTEIRAMSTGFGKVPVERVVLTHNHFDHTEGVAAVKKAFGARVSGFAPDPLVDEKLHGGEMLRLGDQDLEVIHIPGHSDDSICLYCDETHTLFSGDTPVRILTPGGSYSDAFVQGLERLVRRDIRAIYPGHGDPIKTRAREVLSSTLRNVKASQAANGGRNSSP